MTLQPEHEVKEAKKNPESGAGSSPRRFTWEEIGLRTGRGHPQQERWLVIDRKVYDISQFYRRHPGGARVISHFAGQDATEVFVAFHVNHALVRKYMSSLLIGELTPDEISMKPSKNSQAGYLQHDLGHFSVFSKPKWNHVVQKFVIGQLLGLPASWWNLRHAQHHAKTNCFLKDPDLNMHPWFTLGKVLSVEDLAWMLSFYIRFFLTYEPLLGVKSLLGFYLLIRVLESIWLVWVTQMNHIPMNIDYDKNLDWFSTQLQATCNVDQSLFNDWFTGHLNFHIEHHLFPTMPRHNYWKVAPLVKSLCAKHGIEYHCKPLLTGFADIVQL
ncbi:unnamed protein product [Caretta caretta]